MGYQMKPHFLLAILDIGYCGALDTEQERIDGPHEL